MPTAIERKHVFIFGAGASYGSQENAPPVTAGLISNLVKLYPDTWGRLGWCRRQKLKRNFEFQMDRLLQRQARHLGLYGHHLMLMHKQLGAYFYSFGLQQNSLYKSIVRLIPNTPSIITLNYDCLLKLALDELEIHYAIPEWKKGMEANAEEWEVIFPHGNCEFGPSGNNQLLNNSIDCDPRRGIVVNNDPEFFAAEQIKDYINQVVPAMAYIVPNKSDHISCGSFLRRQQKLTSTRICQAKKIVIIGVAVNFNDLHIWDSLAKTKGKICYVGPETNVFREWMKQHKRTDRIIEKIFADAIDDIAEFVC